VGWGKTYLGGVAPFTLDYDVPTFWALPDGTAQVSIEYTSDHAFGWSIDAKA
jgi:hypothetical protein